MSFLDDSLSGTFWGSVKDDFYTLADKAIEWEKAKNSSAQLAERDTYAAAITPTTTDPNPNIKPVSADQIRQTQTGAGVVNVAGVQVNKTALMVAGAALAVVVLAKVL